LCAATDNAIDGSTRASSSMMTIASVGHARATQFFRPHHPRAQTAEFADQGMGNSWVSSCRMTTGASRARRIHGRPLDGELAVGWESPSMPVISVSIRAMEIGDKLGDLRAPRSC
jgi:hypothetical protein